MLSVLLKIFLFGRLSSHALSLFCKALILLYLSLQVARLAEEQAEAAAAEAVVDAAAHSSPAKPVRSSVLWRVHACVGWQRTESMCTALYQTVCITLAGLATVKYMLIACIGQAREEESMYNC